MERRGVDGPSHVSVGGHLEKMNSGVFSLLEQTLCRSVVGTMVHHKGLILSFSDRTEDAIFILCYSHGIVSVNLYVPNPNT